MTTFRLLPFLLGAGLCALAGCQNIDTTPQPKGDRVLKGTVNYRSDVVLPADAVVTVRLLDISQSPVRILSEQTFPWPGSLPIPFQLDYQAEDIQPPQRAGMDARITAGGKLRYYNSTPIPISPNSAEGSFTVWVEQVRANAR